MTLGELKKGQKFRFVREEHRKFGKITCGPGCVWVVIWPAGRDDQLASVVHTTMEPGCDQGHGGYVSDRRVEIVSFAKVLERVEKE